MDFPLADYSYLPLFHALDLPNIATLLCLMLTEAKILLQTKHYGMQSCLKLKHYDMQYHPMKQHTLSPQNEVHDVHCNSKRRHV